MQRIALEPADYFLLTRALAYGAVKTLRHAADPYGEELRLTPASALDREPATASPEEVAAAAARAAAFFDLEPDAADDLVGLPDLGAWADRLFELAGGRPRAVVFLTSGSTGAPSAVRKPFFFLEQDARLLANMLAGSSRVVSLVPPHHIYGFLYGVIIPKILGAPVLDWRFRKPADVVRDLLPGDAVIGIPRLWKLLVETGLPFPANVAGVVSTGPCPAEVIRNLRQNGLAVMHEIYGSSESGAMGFRGNPDEPMTLLGAWKRAGENAFVRELENGGASEPFVFQDHLEWLDAARFYVKGRTDRAVQVAGANVSLAKVRAALLEHPAATDCAVRLMRPDEGDRLKAFVVLKPNHEPDAALRESLRKHLVERLAPLERPKSLTFGESLPKSDMGKDADWPIRPERRVMSREEALEKLRRDPLEVAPGKKFEVDRFRPEDAPGVAKLFYAVYGESYPFEVYYIPERLIEENRRGAVISVTARTVDGEIVGYGALYRSSPPFHGAYEVGQYLILPAYRNSRAFYRINEHLVKTVIPERKVAMFFGETVCHHIVTQKIGALSGGRESALEIGLMPAGAYERTDYPDDRVSTLLQFRVTQDKRLPLFIPEIYRDDLAFFMEGFELDRDVQPAEEPAPHDVATRAATEFFDFAQVARLQVTALGHDFERVLTDFEEQALRRGARIMQVYVNLGEPWCALAAELTRERGYFIGGYLPRWFDADGLLMQKVLDLPDMGSIKLFSERARQILERVWADMEGNPACRAAREAAAAQAQAPGPQAGDLEPDEVVLTGEGLTLAALVAAARRGRPVRLTDDPAVLARMDSSAFFIEWGVRVGEPIYGVNTGFGGMANVRVNQEDLCALQQNLLRFLNAGAGEALPEEDVRAAMILRANSHLRGASGVRRELVDRLILFLNRQATPVVRELGSIGASGDLVPLASIAGAVTGAAPCFLVDLDGERLDSPTALKRLGLSPLPLGPKEGLAMVNGTSVMTGMAALRLCDARRLTALCLGFHALAVQALRGSNQSFHPFVQALKPHPGQVLAAELMLTLLRGSRMCRDELDGRHDSQGDQPVQDRYSLRCLPQFMGPILDGLRLARQSLETEMNAATDNPLIDGEACVSYHGGNFLGQYVAVWMDHLRYYLGLAAKHMDAQIALLVAPEFNNGLPASLTGNPDRDVNMGLKGLQIAANSVMPLLSFYGAPVADRFPTHAEQFNQNINSQGFNAALLAKKSVTTMDAYLAMALIFGVQAVSLRAFAMRQTHDPRGLLSPETAGLYRAVLSVMGLAPRPDRPPIRDDDEQSLEELVERLRADIAADGTVVAAVSGIMAAL